MKCLKKRTGICSLCSDLSPCDHIIISSQYHISISPYKYYPHTLDRTRVPRVWPTRHLKRLAPLTVGFLLMHGRAVFGFFILKLKQMLLSFVSSRRAQASSQNRFVFLAATRQAKQATRHRVIWPDAASRGQLLSSRPGAAKPPAAWPPKYSSFLFPLLERTKLHSEMPSEMLQRKVAGNRPVKLPNDMLPIMDDTVNM